MRPCVALLSVVALTGCDDGGAWPSLPGAAPRVAVAPVAQGPVRCRLPPRDCDLRWPCTELVRLLPVRGRGYEDVQLDGQRTARTSTSYLRRDLMMLVKYATAKVACVADGWPGNGGALALGDMSERDGAVPGTARGQPRHPAGSHVFGLDIDLAYYQVGTVDNELRAICEHAQGGIDQHHCTGAPLHLDAARTALLIGALFESPRLRIIGVDGAAAPAIEVELTRLCADGTLERAACARVRLGHEGTDGGLGWYYGHHAHLHVSTWAH